MAAWLATKSQLNKTLTEGVSRKHNRFFAEHQHAALKPWRSSGRSIRHISGRFRRKHFAFPGSPVKFASMIVPRCSLFLVLALARSVPAAEIAQQPETKPERVPFPKNYPAAFQAIRASNKTAQTKLGTIYGNAPASSVKDLAQLPYPDGAVFVMEWADPARDATGEPLVDSAGNWLKGEVTRIDVMRREKGFGAAHEEKRADEWEFASYRPDGTPISLASNPTSCAECHTKARERDFVFRGRFPAIK